MDVNRFETLVITSPFLGGGDTIEQPILAEVLYFRKDPENGRPVAGTYLGIIAAADSQTVTDALNAAINAPAPATMREAARMMPRVHAISVGSLFRTYECRLADGTLATLQHGGNLSIAVRASLHEGNDFAALETEFNTMIANFIQHRNQQGNQQGNQQNGGGIYGGQPPIVNNNVEIVCSVQTRILSKRNNIVPFLNYDLQ